MTDWGLSASGMLLSGENEAGGGHGRFFVGQTSGEICPQATKASKQRKILQTNNIRSCRTSNGTKGQLLTVERATFTP